ncbi:Hypothetical protein SRAE_X000103800 [Strongyloides ratti]|uniref:Uncharacterized protein n=1 Tax=Strongyloides ratti TaxID=34506 RepID=A0A090KVM4_STRRB|nr:Hypothetical protein SRAE_X000103800 [Strongyloides ratti]CEF59287.1 Hypothetical protein SRAE_X000103800 [Strongyloides ratti]
MSKLENSIIDDNSGNAGLVVFIIITAIAGLIIFAIIIFLLISSSRRKHFQNRMANIRRSLSSSIRFRQNQNTAQVSPGNQQNIIIDSAYLSPAHIIGLSPPKYDSAPPSYDEVVNNQSDPTPPYSPTRGSNNIGRSTDTPRVHNSSTREALTIFPREELEENHQIVENNASAVIQVTEIVTNNKTKLQKKNNKEENINTRNDQKFTNNDANNSKNNKINVRKSSLEVIESNAEIPNLENVQIS